MKKEKKFLIISIILLVLGFSGFIISVIMFFLKLDPIYGIIIIPSTVLILWVYQQVERKHRQEVIIRKAGEEAFRRIVRLYKEKRGLR